MGSLGGGTAPLSAGAGGGGGARGVSTDPPRATPGTPERAQGGFSPPCQTTGSRFLPWKGMGRMRSSREVTETCSQISSISPGLCVRYPVLASSGNLAGPC